MTLPKFSLLAAAQNLLIAGLLALSISPALANIFEAIVFVAVLAVPSLRRRVGDFFRGAAGWWLLAFAAILCSAILYASAGSETTIGSIVGWRRLLLLPLAAALFLGDVPAKRRAVLAFFYASALLALFSYVVYFFPAQFPKFAEPGIVVRNHATQGIFFSAAFVSGLAAFQSKWISGRTLQALGAAALALLFFNVSLLVTGRSGYVCLLVMVGAYLVLNQARGLRMNKFAVAAAATAVAAAVLALSPIAREKIMLAYTEAEQADANIQKNAYTSVGVRIMFWRNTLHMIPAHPFLGVGTGGFGEAYGREVAGRPGLAGLGIGDPHNQYMKILAENGVAGLIAFLGLLVAVARRPATRPFKSLGLCVLLAWCITSLANSHFSTFSEGHFIWIWLGIMLAAEPAPDGEDPVL